MAWLKIAVALGFAADLIVAPKLWLSSREYPLAPVTDLLPRLHSPLDAAWYGTLFILLAVIVWVRRPRPYLIACVVLAALYTLWDQARWMPPTYQYTFILAALAFYPWNRSDDARAQAVLNTCRVVMASTYFWAGLQKINVTFLWTVFPWVLKPLVGTLPDVFRGWPLPLGLLAAVAEAGIGIGLLTQRYRHKAVGAAIVMHGFILLSIGPWGHRWDVHVWPWNLVMAVSVVVLFWRADDVRLREIVRVRRFRLHPVVCVLFALMPALSLVDGWDSYLSAALYSGNTQYAVVYLTDTAKGALPAEVQRYVRNGTGGRHVLDLFSWSFGELNVEPYPEARVFKTVTRRLCRYPHFGAGITLVIHGKPEWRTGRRTTAQYTCADLNSN